MSKYNFLKELKRRNVYRVGLTYVIIAWVVLQVVSVIVPMMEAPAWIGKVVLIILLTGFPIALVLAWAFEMSPQGIIMTNSEETTENPIPGKKKHATSNTIIGVLVVVIIGQFLYNGFIADAESEKSNIESIAHELSIAVLPLINLNAKDENLDYFSDGVTQEIIDQVAKINAFTVRAFSSVFVYKNKQIPPIDIAKDLEVDYLISGSSRIIDERFILSIELFNPHTKERIWNETFKTSLNNTPTIQVSIARKVAENLNISLTPDESQSIAEVGTTDGEAFGLFLKAKNEINKTTIEGFVNTRNYLSQALILDPDYAQAHTLYAWSYLFEGHPLFNPNAPSSSTTIELAMPHIDKAIELDPESSDIFLIRGNLHKNYTHNLAQAKKDVDHGIELNSWPKVPTNYCTCTIVSTYIAIGLYEEAGELVAISAKVDPLNFFIHSDAGLILTLEGEFEKAQQKLISAVEFLDIPYLNLYLGIAYYHDKKYEKSIEHFEKTRFKSDGSILSLGAAFLSNAYRMIGNLEKSDFYRKELEAQVESGKFHRNHAMAIMEAGEGNVEETLAWLEKAFESKDGDLGAIMSDLIFDPYRKEPRFETIVAAMVAEE